MALKMAITGSHGMIGSYLCDHFGGMGHSVTRIVRAKTSTYLGNPSVYWNIKTKIIDANALEGLDAVIHLAGVRISEKWTPEYKNLIRSSRVNGTRFLSETLAGLKNPPKVFFSASAVGYYGNHPGNNVLNEKSPIGHDFLAKVCDDWEKATHPAQDAGLRVVHMRSGVVLNPAGGALAKMLPIFKWGLGGKLGSGKQLMSWVALEEFPAMIIHVIENENICGPVNFVSPQPVSNAEFTRALGKVLKRPTIFSVPSFGIKKMFGEMGEALLLGGAGVKPVRLIESGYRFQYPNIETALEECLS